MAGKRKRARPEAANKPTVVKYSEHAAGTPFKLRSRETHSDGAASNATFKNRLKEEVAQYLADIATSLEEGRIDLTDAEDSSTLISAVLSEIKGHEKNAALDASASRLVERLVVAMDEAHITQLLCSLASKEDDLYDVATSPYGSHLLELLLMQLESSFPDGLGEAAAQALSQLIEAVAACLQRLVVHKYGSFVARRVVAVLSGVSFEQHQGDGKAGTSHNGKRQRAHGGLAAKTSVGQQGGAAPHKGRQQQQQASLLGGPSAHARHPELLQKVVDAVLLVDANVLSMLCRDQFASPFLQCVLRTCQACSITGGYTDVLARCLHCTISKKKPKAKKSKSKEAVGKGDTEVQGKSEAFMKLAGFQPQNALVLLEDRIGSHFAEVMFSTAPPLLYDALFRHILRGNMLKLAHHPAANFALQSALAAMRTEEQVSVALTELSAAFPSLLTKHRGGVVAALVTAAVRHHTQGAAVCAALAQLAKQQRPVVGRAGMEAEQESNSADAGQQPKGNRQQLSKAPLLRLLLLDSREDNPTMVPEHPDAPVYLSTIGCALLCSVFALPQTECQTFSNAVAALSREELVTLCCNPGGNRVVEAFLEGPASKKQARAVYTSLKGQWDQVALAGMSGCVFVDKCFARADMPSREDIVSSLAEGMKQLARTTAGSGLLQRLHVEQYSRDAAAWKRKQAANAAVAKEFTDILRTAAPTVQPGGSNDVVNGVQCANEGGAHEGTGLWSPGEGKAGTKKKAAEGQGTAKDMDGDGAAAHAAADATGDPGACAVTGDGGVPMHEGHGVNLRPPKDTIKKGKRQRGNMQEEESKGRAADGGGKGAKKPKRGADGSVAGEGRTGMQDILGILATGL